MIRDILDVSLFFGFIVQIFYQCCYNVKFLIKTFVVEYSYAFQTRSKFAIIDGSIYNRLSTKTNQQYTDLTYFFVMRPTG